MTAPNVLGLLPRGLGTTRRFGKGARIFRRGDPVRGVFLVLEGEVRLCRFGPRGEEVVLQRARSGELLAEAALESPRYHCDAIATEPGRLLQLPAQALRKLLKSDPGFMYDWTRLLSRELRRARARLERMTLKSAADRLRHYLATEGSGPACETVLSGSLKGLARELGVAHETLYRTIAAMQRRGELERSGQRLRLRLV
jgi:CRP/FNR family transcriptional regulator, dissimilatory nitrate respiration regulator